ncbi:MAG: hypothetical protein Q9190_000918 [Brigantiaea leucoxantha]
MVTRKAPLSWAEEIAELSNTLPKGYQTISIGRSDEDSSANESSGEAAQAREHYAEVEISTLREPAKPVLGLEYRGSQKSRDAIFANLEESDDDPFAPRHSKQKDSEDSEDGTNYSNPDEVGLNNADIGEDDEIEREEVLNEADEEPFGGHASRRSKKPHVQNLDKHQDLEDNPDDEDGFSILRQMCGQEASTNTDTKTQEKPMTKRSTQPRWVTQKL